MNKFDLIRKLTEIEYSLRFLDDKIIGKELSRKDIAVAVIFPLNISGFDSAFFLHEVDNEEIVKGIVNIRGEFTGVGHIYIEHNPEDETYVWNEVLWTYVKGMMFDTISHELCHLYQYDIREMRGVTDIQRIVSKKEYKSILLYDDNDSGIYLAGPDEVEAYSYNLASQLFRKYRSVDAAIAVLRSGECKDLEVYQYVSDFIKKDSYIWKRYMKKTIFYLINKYSENTYIASSETMNDNNNI